MACQTCGAFFVLLLICGGSMQVSQSELQHTQRKALQLGKTARAFNKVAPAATAAKVVAA
jgi:hypothetical protein